MYHIILDTGLVLTVEQCHDDQVEPEERRGPARGLAQGPALPPLPPPRDRLLKPSADLNISPVHSDWKHFEVE